MSQETDVAAIKAALNAALPMAGVAAAHAQAYEYDEPRPGESPLTPQYVRIDLTRRYTGRFLASGEESVSGGRLVTHYVGPNVTTVRELRRITKTVVEDKALGDVGPFVFETEGDIEPNAGSFEARDLWTC